MGGDVMAAVDEIPDQAARFPRVPTSITLDYLKMWLGVLGLPLEHLAGGTQDRPSIRFSMGGIEVDYYAVRPDSKGRDTHFAIGSGKAATIAMHTIVIPVIG